MLLSLGSGNIPERPERSIDRSKLTHDVSRLIVNFCANQHGRGTIRSRYSADYVRNCDSVPHVFGRLRVVGKSC